MSGEVSDKPGATATGFSRAWGAWKFSPGELPSAQASGCDGAGWDWGRFEGTTVPYLPLDKLDQGWTGISATVRSPETFVGGLSHRGRQGVFAMVLNQAIMPENKIVKGRKSWFFSDDRILCLGSDISCDEAQYPTQTTICQKALRINGQGEIRPTSLDGAGVTALPEERTLDPARPHWFLDVQQTGYYVPVGQKVTMRKHQASRDVDDLKNTEGDFLTAWIDHGKAPKTASYEYMLVVRATPEAMQRLAADPPFRVIQRDVAAHVIWDTADRRWGCVFFVPQEVTPHAVASETLPIKAVDRPCLVMAQVARDGQLDVSVTDPDLTPDDHGSKPHPLRVTLRGTWRLLEARGTVCVWPLKDAKENVRILSATRGRNHRGDWLSARGKLRPEACPMTGPEMCRVATPADLITRVGQCVLKRHVNTSGCESRPVILSVLGIAERKCCVSHSLVVGRR